ncbi:MAG: extracellular solute-binding protein [Acetatifactor sp.]|nr:extracellular solute-binding protein [Acetatifactor sp.]
MSNIRDCKQAIKGWMGEDVTFVGFPTADSNGSTINAGNYTFVISARSKHTEGAWQFVRQYLTPEYQSGDQIWDMPVLKSAFLDQAKKAMERPYWTDENGNKEYYDDTWYVNGEDIVLEPFTQEEVDEICEFIYSVNRLPYYNENISNIITEEAEAFFVGQKSVQEVAGVIQSRVQVYVNENR